MKLFHKFLQCFFSAKSLAFGNDLGLAVEFLPCNFEHETYPLSGLDLEVGYEALIPA